MANEQIEKTKLEFEPSVVETEAEFVKVEAIARDAVASPRARFGFYLFLTMLVGLACGAAAAMYLLTPPNHYYSSSH